MTESTEPNFICMASGFKRKLNRMVRQWDGALVDYQFVDRRNPQDFVTGVPDNQGLPLSNPESPDVFIDPLVNPVRVEDL